MSPDKPEGPHDSDSQRDTLKRAQDSAATKQRTTGQYIADAKAQGVTNCGCAVQK